MVEKDVHLVTRKNSRQTIQKQEVSTGFMDFGCMFIHVPKVERTVERSSKAITLAKKSKT